MKGVRAWMVVMVAALATALLRVTPVFDPDYFWHIETGRWVLAHREVPRVDVFSYTYRGQPWRFVDWVADALMALLHRAGGHGAVIVSFALVGGVAVGCALAHAAAVTRTTRWQSLAVAALALVGTIAFRNTPRPQTLTFVCAWGLLASLGRTRDDARWLVAVPLWVALWQNLHSSATLAVILVAAWAFGTRIEGAPTPSLRAWGATLLASCGALLVNVRPLDRLAAGFVHLFDHRVAEMFDEWSPVWALHAVFPGVHAFGVLLLLAALAWLDPPRARALPLPLRVAQLVCVVLALRTIRFIPVAAIALAPAAVTGADVVYERTRGVARVVALGVLVALGGWALARMQRPFGVGVAHTSFPIDATRWALARRPRGHVFHDFHAGGYLLHASASAQPVFIDGRSMAVYGVDFTWDALTARDPAVVALLQRYDVGWALLPMSTRVGLFQRLPGWSLVYFDDDAFVAVRDAANPSLADTAGYRALHPASWASDIERLARDPVALAAAEREAQRALRDAPTSALPRVMAASVAMAHGDFTRAEAWLAEARRIQPSSLPVLRASMVRCLRTNDRACACAMAAAVLARAPTNESARNVRRTMICDAP